MQKPWIEIIDNQGLVERVANERQNHDLFGELPNGKSKPQRLELVERPTLGLSEILYGPPKGLRHVVLSLGRRIVAVAGVQNDHYDQTHLAITHLSVEEEHRGKGFARMLIEAIYDYAVVRKWCRVLFRRRANASSTFTSS